MIRKVLLHVQKFMPDFLIKLCMSDERYADKPYVLSQHMEEHLINPNFKHNIEYRELLDCVNSLKQSPVKPFELEVIIDDNPTGKNNNKTYTITKWVVRMPYDEDQDISIAVRGNVIVTAWLQSDEWLDYYELDNYIFVHSFIPLHSKDGLPGYYIYDKELEYFPSWRTEATPAEWEDSRWGCPWKNYKDGLFKDEEQKGKTLVCGHWHVSDFWAKLGNWPIDGTESNIYYSKGIIGIDCGVFVDYRGFERTFIHPQEVLVIDNNICYDKYGVKLEEQHNSFRTIKTVSK